MRRHIANPDGEHANQTIKAATYMLTASRLASHHWSAEKRKNDRAAAS